MHSGLKPGLRWWEWWGMLWPPLTGAAIVVVISVVIYWIKTH